MILSQTCTIQLKSNDQKVQKQAEAKRLKHILRRGTLEQVRDKKPMGILFEASVCIGAFVTGRSPFFSSFLTKIFLNTAAL